ncbi:hypothetical protein CTI12_AA146090 [Artemisia annua]|uniref:Uncharacterized protein n=1 Tax=Artemisia annua TaxID=35608 RepID=A0A2U1PJ96_ARTAN|nr:hypothetical protein CTI12_AA146090 [Artemisia annua]
MEEDRLGEEAAKLLHDDQQADLERIHEIKVKEVELAAARDTQIRMQMDDNVAAEVSADVPLVNTSVETPESPDVYATEPSSYHSIYIPDVAIEPNILRVVNFQDLMTIGRPEQHLHINGLLSRGVQARNMNAEYTMAKVILGGEAPLWETMLENDRTARSIKCATTLPLYERRGIAKSLNTNNTANLSYILFSSKDQPHLPEPYWNLYYSRVVRSFIILSNSNDVMILRKLRGFIEFFVGYHRYSESNIENSITDLYHCWMYMFWYSVFRSRGAPIPKEYLKFGGGELSVETIKWYKDQVIKALITLFMKKPHHTNTYDAIM